MIKNLKVTNHFTENQKKGKLFKLLMFSGVILVITSSFAGCSSDKKEQEITYENVQIVQYQQPDTEYVNVENIFKYDDVDTTGKTDIEMTIGNVEIGPSRYNIDDKQEAIVDLSIEQENNCADFICIVDKNTKSEEINSNFEQFIKGENNNQDRKFINVTGKDFAWKTERIEDPITKEYGKNSLPEDINNDKYKKYISDLTRDGKFFETMTFEICSTRNTRALLFRYNYENNCFYKYDLTTAIRLDTKDWKGKGPWSPFSNTSQGYKNLLTERKEFTTVTIHGETCALHKAQQESVKLLRREMV